MTLRWGICSAGLIANDFVVALKTLPEKEHQVVAVAARSLDSASKFAETHSIPRHYGSYQDLANDTEVDVVYIGNLHVQHLETVMMMFEAGKPVLCEKPMTTSMKNVIAMIQAAKEKDIFLMEGIWTRFFPAIVELQKQIAEGVIGEVKYVSANFGFRREVLPSRYTDPKLGGSSLFFVGIYPINFATMIFGEKPESVHADGWLFSTGVDEFAAITLKYSGERVAQLTCSTNLALPKEAVVAGTRGTLKLPSPFWCPTKLETPTGVLEFPLPSPHLPMNYTNSTGLRYEAMEVKACLELNRKECETMPLSHTQITTEIMEDAMKQLGVVCYK